MLLTADLGPLPRDWEGTARFFQRVNNVLQARVEVGHGIGELIRACGQGMRVGDGEASVLAHGAHQW